MSDFGTVMGVDPTLSRNATADAALARAKSGLSEKKLKDIDAASKDFEASFISEMIKPMFDTVQTDSEFGGGEAEDTWKSMMIQEYGKQISQAGGFGLSDDIKQKMIEMQEIANK